MGMGFAEHEVDGALSAWHGEDSLAASADWLLVEGEAAEGAPVDREEAEGVIEAAETHDNEGAVTSEPEEEWQELVQDVVQMGFDAESGRAALRANGGNLRAAVKTLVAMEREGADEQPREEARS